MTDDNRASQLTARVEPTDATEPDPALVAFCIEQGIEESTAHNVLLLEREYRRHAASTFDGAADWILEHDRDGYSPPEIASVLAAKVRFVGGDVAVAEDRAREWVAANPDHNRAVLKHALEALAAAVSSLEHLALVERDGTVALRQASYRDAHHSLVLVFRALNEQAAEPLAPLASAARSLLADMPEEWGRDEIIQLGGSVEFPPNRAAEIREIADIVHATHAGAPLYKPLAERQRFPLFAAEDRAIDVSDPPHIRDWSKEKRQASSIVMAVYTLIWKYPELMSVATATLRVSQSKAFEEVERVIPLVERVLESAAPQTAATTTKKIVRLLLREMGFPADVVRAAFDFERKERSRRQRADK